MNNTPRFLPVALVFAVALLAVKASDVWEGTQQLIAELSVAEAMAQEDPALAAEPPAEGEPEPEPEPGEGGAVEGEGALAPAEPAGPLTLNPNSPFTAAELDMLQRLALRREELNAREAEMGLRANLLAVTEARIEGRIAELRAVEATIQSLLITYDEQEEAQLQSVVAIYEAMKPGDAAKIFNNLDMMILIELAERMRERLIAPILADMETDAANALTVELATRRSLPVTGRPAE
jgi:flagellar motility protein MotE (MotC chaperone)